MGDCPDTSLQGACADTTLSGLGATGVSGVERVFPGNNGAELPLWDSVAAEPAKLAGTPFRLYALRRARHRHPLYAEPATKDGEWDFHGPWELSGAFEFAQAEGITTIASSEGTQKTADAVLYVSRKALESIGAPEPKVGDVIDLWDRAPFKTKFQFWDVVKANPDGNLFTAEAFVQYRLELVHRSRFEPGRKVLGESP